MKRVDQSCVPPELFRFSYDFRYAICTRKQRIIFRTLRVLFKSCKTYESQLNTYFIKTIMLWFCEDKMEQYWKEKSLIHIIEEAFLKTVNCLEEKIGRAHV